MKLPERSGLSTLANIMTWIAFIFSFLLMAYTGVLLASSNQPMWSGTLLLPCLFLASAVSSGLGLVVMVAAITRAQGVSAHTLTRLAEADALVIIIEAAILVAFALWLGNPQLSGAAQALAMLTSGPPAWASGWAWSSLALVIPLALHLVYWGKERAALMAGLVSAGCVIVEGIFLRAVIVIGGQLYGGQAPDTALLNDILIRFPIPSHYVCLIDKDGIVRLGRPALPGLSGADLSRLTHPGKPLGMAQLRTQITISDALYDPIIGKLVVYMVRPVEGQQGEAPGATVVALDLSHAAIQPLIYPSSPGTTAYTEVFDSRGIALATTLGASHTPV